MLFWLCSILSRSCSQKEQERKGNAKGHIITKLMYGRWLYQSKTRDDLTAILWTTKITCQHTYKYALSDIVWRAWQPYKASTYWRKITNIRYANIDNRSVTWCMDVDKVPYFSHLRFYKSEQLPLCDFLQYQSNSRRLQLTLKRKLGLGLRVYIANNTNPWADHLCSNKKLLGSR